MKSELTIGLVGNPNSGKTTLFNALTGSRQRVGNWSGVTVDKKMGRFEYQNTMVNVVDLPGTYSLSVLSENGSIDERIACDYILSGDSDVIVNIIDASNLERNLYLTTQLLEMGVPVVLAVNMLDIAKQRGLKLDLDKLAQVIGCPVVGLVARKAKGLGQLKEAIIAAQSDRPVEPKYREPLQSAIDQLSAVMKAENRSLTNRLAWQAVRLLENDFLATQQWAGYGAVCEKVTYLQQQLLDQSGQDAELLLADSRYRQISRWLDISQQQTKSNSRNLTTWVDKLVLNRWLGLPIFLFIMYLMFEFAITIGGALQPLFDQGSSVIFIQGVSALGHDMGLPIWITAILAQGVGLGLNTVLTFIPQIGGLFLFLCFLEGSGYMARAAFVMDRVMQWVGLPGKSFVPLIVGFGCNVPAIMATRTLDSRRDRLLTIFMSPFMSCGARLAIFAVFSAAFFPQGGAIIVFLLYVTGIVVAILTGLLLKLTVLKGEPSPFVMELPPYHLPSAKNVLLHTWQRLRHFLFRAGKYIVPICIIIGSLNSIQLNGHIDPQGSQQSILSEVGRVVTPVLSPMGIQQSNWPATVGLMTGILAKEVVVGTLNTLYTQNNHGINYHQQDFHFWAGIGQAFASTYDSLTHLSASSFANPFKANEADHNMSQTSMGNMVIGFGGPLAAFAFMLFVLLYVPCVSAAGAMVREAGKAWAWLSVGWSFIIAYALSVIVYQIGTFSNHVIGSSVWIGAMLALLLVTILAMKFYALKGPSKILPDQPLPASGCGTKAACGGCRSC